MNNVNVLHIWCEFMAACFIRILFLCTTPELMRLSSAQIAFGDFGHSLIQHYVDVGLKFVEEPSDIIVAPKKSAELHCRARSSFNETVSVEWLRNDKKIKDTTRMRANNEILKVTPKKKKNGTAVVSDRYQCKAYVVTRGSSPAVLISRPAHVQIARLSPITATPNETIISSIGKAERLSCEFTSVPAANVSWTFQNQSLQLSDPRYDTSVQGVLYISDLKLSDSGIYSCHVTNQFLPEPEIRSDFHVRIVDSAIAVVKKLYSRSPSTVRKIDVHNGHNLTLECFDFNDGDRQVMWMFSSLEGSQNNTITKNQYFSILRIINVTWSDAGQYSCVVVRDDSSVLEIMKYDVTVGAPPRFTVVPKSQNITLAHRIHFDCVATGHPKPVIRWLRNGKTILENARVLIRPTRLLLSNANNEDFGMYQCIASNSFGIVYSSARLYMIDIVNPSSPTNLSCVATSSTAIRLSWQQPNDVNNQPPVAFTIGNDGSIPAMSRVYVIEYYPADVDHNEQLTQPATTNSFVLESLTPNTKYILSVRCFQGKSGSDPSKVVACTTLEEDQITTTTKSVNCSSPDCNYSRIPPVTPTDTSVLHLELINDTTVSVTWTMETPTLTIDKYFVRYKKSNSDESMMMPVNFDRKGVFLKNLEPRKQYEVTLIFIWNGTEATVDSKTITTSQRLLLGISTVSSNAFTLIWNSKSKNDHYSILYGEKGKNPMNVTDISDGNITITGLKPNTKYQVEIQEHSRNGSTESAFIVVQTLPIKNGERDVQSTAGFPEKTDNSLDSEQILGIIIGSAMSLMFIVLCVVLIIYCKRRIEKNHNHNRMLHRNHIFFTNGKREMKSIARNSKVHNGTYANGHGSNLNVPLSLLSGAGGYSNGCIQNADFGKRNIFYELDSKTRRDENDQLLRGLDSPLNETMAGRGDADHEGGDSGYCDRNQPHSPQLKDGDGSQRFRNCSDVTTDDGFYENEAQPAGGCVSALGCESSR